ncbi:hypothetical protein GJAV_G00191960 [Gymnothorax javanicus]|nr:hypothetical protein GJAV_G00191960 [Gymnothorax javanicus]
MNCVFQPSGQPIWFGEEAMHIIDVQNNLVGERRASSSRNEYWLYVWMRRLALITAHVVALGFTVLMSVLSRPGTSFFSWHPMCMSISFCLCMTEGILLFSEESSPFCFKSRKRRMGLHWFLQFLVVVGGATGVGFMFASKWVSERPHLASWHSVVGVCTLVATAIQTVCGLCILCPNIPLRLPPPPRLRLYHTTAGLVAYLLAVTTVMLAMFSDWFQATIRGLLWYPVAVLPLIPALVVMNQITRAYLPRMKMAV